MVIYAWTRLKVRAIQEWEAPIKVTELRSFLGLVNYYHRFISGYSAKAAPLTELLKQNKSGIWTERYQKAFEGLKAAVTEEPVLALPNFAKIFEVHTDASHFTIGGVLATAFSDFRTCSALTVSAVSLLRTIVRFCGDGPGQLWPHL
ncbi:PREDICTED: uncharacterized protein LOC109213946 [Nicotiana attenuata]|uniref:uncharacterized protein LOC109213946 n=1 Tax=Nicotiana attenuata TaxID=49451 RepID=UPI0009048747|nr:PREDICTED: uncharacterized protein LOC109213946 [Nicotiana attenuata]